MNLGIFQETKITKRIYTRKCSGYRVVAMKAPSVHSVDIDVLYRVAYQLSVEALQTYGANVFSFQMASGDRRWFIMGLYLGPRQRLDNRGCRRGHQIATPGGRAAGVWTFQHQPFRNRGLGAVRGYCSGYGGGGPGGHERPLPPTAQAVVEGRPYMGHAPGQPGCALPDRLHPGHRQSSIPKLSCLGCKA